MERRALTAITIGVPVFNGADFLAESLDCLANQTFIDFEVYIFDNASTDGTADIARAWAARDPRFHYHLQPRNVGGVNNFRDALLSAKSTWFLWRAHDDLSAINYLEELYALASKSEKCQLAVSTVLTVDHELSPSSVSLPPRRYDPLTVAGRLRALYDAGYTPCWFYGLWRREAAVRAFVPVVERYPYAFAGDHLTLYGPIIEGGVLTTTRTHFISRAAPPRPTSAPRERKPFSVMWEIRRAFVRELRRIRAERSLSFEMKLALIFTQPRYLRRSLPSMTKMARTGLRALLGIAGPKSTSWHIEKRT